ncbi:MAG: GAF and ANTAR domain-containing protein [Intrasporangium sp.]|uniref:GAF and ANTAR domain-containing protein n=1 Tax=Intrasporangium sp. TaxID=1925024 RepID=UPI003F808DB6
MDSARQDRLFAHLAAIADDLVSGLDVADLADRVMHGCLDLLDAASAGLVLDDHEGTLGVLACSSDDAKALELLELQSREGPCYKAFFTGDEILVDDMDAMEQEWPAFVPAARSLGITTAAAVPLLLAGETIGALNLFRTEARSFSRRDLQLARLLCSVATVGIVHDRRQRDHDQLTRQLQSALESRVCIEQAKGVIAARAGVNVTAAFEMLRSAARASQRPLTELAADIVAGRLPATRLIRRAGSNGGRSTMGGTSDDPP